MQKIFKNNTIKCPICRRKTRCVEVEQLNTNTNALLAEIESQRPRLVAIIEYSLN